MKRSEDILSKLLLQNNDDWEIENVVCDDSVEEIRITLKYRHSTIKVDGNEFPILDFRHERSWRHLDMWQYKTVLEAKIPRYRDGVKVKSVPVPWALPNSRLSWLMKKNGRSTTIYQESNKDCTLLRLSFEQVHGVILRAVERGLEKRDKNRIYKHVCMDEKYIRRGHEYVSMLYGGDIGQVIEVESGRKSESVDNLCTKALTEEQRNAVGTVCTDMWEAFINGALKYFPNARHYHDLYHCVTYLNDAVDKVRKRAVKEFKELRHTKYMWLKDMSRYTSNDRMRFDKLENAEYQVSQAWKVKELFRDLLRLHYRGDVEAYGMLGDWMADALQYNIGEINDVVFMFKRHLKGIINAMVIGANNGKAERTNGSIQEIKTIGRGYGTAERYRIAILFFYGNLDMSIVNLH